MTVSIYKIGDVDTLDGRGNRLAHGRVNIINTAGKRSWHHFKSEAEWDQFYHLWRALTKPWKLQYNSISGEWSNV